MMVVNLVELPMKIGSDRKTTSEVRFFPRGLVCIARSLLESGFEVRLIDLSRDPLESLIDGADIWGIRVVINQLPLAEAVIATIRERFPEALVIAGGPFPTSAPDFTGLFLRPDYICIGEGEITMSDLLLNLSNSKEVRGVGIVDRRNGKVEVTPSREEVDLTVQPWADPSGLVDLGWYLAGERRPYHHLLPVEGYTLNNMMVSRGCPYDCAFCGHPFGRHVRCRKAEAVIEEVRTWQGLGASFLRHQDDDVTLWPDKLRREIFGAYKTLGVRWEGHIRADRVDEGLLVEMKESGREMLWTGIEFSDDDLLRLAGKGLTVVQLQRTVDLCKAVDIKLGAFCQVGYPGQTDESLEQMVRFVEQNELFPYEYPTMPIPGSRLFSEVQNRLGAQGRLRTYLWDCADWDACLVEEPKRFINLTRATTSKLREVYLRLRELGPGG